MQNEIVRKLNAIITVGPKSEAEVVYFFAQLGKLLEHRGETAKYPSLMFYRNWMLHYRLERLNANPPMRGVFEKLDREAAGIGTFPIEADYLSLSELDSEIAVVLKSVEGFTAESSFSVNRWRNFGALLIELLADLPLICPPEDSSIREFRFIRHSGAKFGMAMQITLHSGEVLSSPLRDNDAD